ncbi:AAA family ATPase [Engelhardtia mirabilis]|uniref:Rad50/SbcC-type AAA domain-containing protein n=1 Tax=Engelhardtia mirabilis TaxID=2528011 RepID=A0A518BL20_9BACT|nr:hypothetical protein Pla133_27570 [Planctomycetes bacterium Pla133]QDV01995.1 hypothetical protein Pla86_27560 [Planctomycetes bacterium Pla86]
MTENTITIENVGAIEHLEIPVPEGGGIVVLRGLNGRGKTTALSAVDRATGGDASLTPRDGAAKGRVDGLGVKLTVGRNTRRSGTLTVSAIAGADPSVLVDPGIKDPERADAARIQALCRLTGLRATSTLFAAAAASCGLDLDRALDGLNMADPVAVAGKLRRDAQARARDLESQSERVRAGALAGKEAAEASEPLDPKDATDAEAERAALASDVAALAEDRTCHERAERELAKLAAESEALRERLDDVEFKQRQIANARPTWGEKQEQALAQRREAIGALDEKVKAERTRIEAFRRLEEAKLQLAASTKLATDAKRVRDAAQGFDGAITELIGGVVPEGMTIEGGRIMVAYGRPSPTPIAELSSGERWRIALDIAIGAAGEGALLVVSQEAWEGLDPINRADLNTAAKERGVVVMTAEAAAGAVRAEIEGGAL